jgi:hypothetical protein
LDPAIETLCGLALRSDRARGAIGLLPWKELLAGEPDGALLGVVMEGAFAPGDPGSVNGFLSRVEGGVGSVLGAIFSRSLPVDEGATERVVGDCWRAIEVRSIKRRQEVLKSRMQAKGLSTEELLKIQKEFLDLDGRFAQIIWPFP